MNIQLRAIVALAAMFVTTAGAFAQTLKPAVKEKVEARLKQIQSWGVDPKLVTAVKELSSNPAPQGKDMTNEKWRGLTPLDPFVRSFTKNSVAEYLKAKKDDSVGEMFASAADGSKLAFLTKTTYWSHKGNQKHEAPMKGKTWIGRLEVDESTGYQMVQVAFPVLDGGKPIGSVVVGLKAAALR